MVISTFPNISKPQHQRRGWRDEGRERREGVPVVGSMVLPLDLIEQLVDAGTPALLRADGGGGVAQRRDGRL